MPHSTPCPACDTTGATVFLRVPQMPVVCNALAPTREQAVAAPRGDIDLAHCNSCGLIFNAAFDPAKIHYDAVYENALHFSPQFREYAEALAQSLVLDFELRGKRIVELGCGDGSFLSRLCQLGGNEGVGFDPAFDPARAAIPPGVNVRFVRELYTSNTNLPAPDFISCRHVLEHIARPVDFLRDLRRVLAANPNAAVFFEVPDASYMLEREAIWDVIYEHCNYFTPAAITRSFELAGFEPLGTASVFGGQFLTMRARAASQGSSPSAKTATPRAALGRNGENATIPVAQRGATQADIQDRFATLHRAKVERWRGVLSGLASRGQRAILWGAGSKGVTFLNTFARELSQHPVLQHAVDLNPRKQGCFVMGSGVEIVAPEALRTIRPSAVIIMNPIYEREIRTQLATLGIQADMLVA